ncbi:MAG: DUF5655 domain-containing protein [Anaerolineae bacterium]|nr:DUF5655 domain-containing protein [Anaerolineae bacterium]
MSELVSIDSHFEKQNPVVSTIYKTLLTALRQFGPVNEAPKKTSIHLENRVAFAGIYTRKHYLLVHFRLDRRLEHARISKWEQLSARRFMHTVRLDQPGDVDGELLGWLGAAYALSA